jgi:ketosteroid isomerase-like protein
MKRYLFCLLVLLVCTSSFAQTKLIDEFPALMKARNADIVGYMKTHTAPTMTFIAGHDGSFQNRDWLLGLLSGQKSNTADVTNLSIQQSGDLGVATGVSTMTAVAADGKTGIYKDAFTYTLRWIDGKWMFTNIQHTKIDYK